MVRIGGFLRSPCAQAVRLGSVLAAGTLLALAAAPIAAGAAEPDQPSAGIRAERLAELKEPRGAPERRQLAQAQGPKPDAAPGEAKDGDRTSPLRWFRYSSDRFRTLMHMLAARSARYEAKRAVEAKAAEEARQAEEAKRAAEAKAEQEAKRVAEAKAADEERRAEEAKRVADAKIAEDAKRMAETRAAEEARRAEEAKRAAEAKAAEDAKRVAEAKAAEEARRAEEAKRVADAKAAEEAKRVADAKAVEEAKRAADARKAVEITQAAEAGRAPAARQPADAKVVAETKKPPRERSKRAAPATCKRAGVKVSGAGWYVAQIGDSLWSIARAHYGYGKAYRRIHAANRRTIAYPSLIYPCQRIYIPRSSLGGAPLQDQRLALAPFVRLRSVRHRTSALRYI